MKVKNSVLSRICSFGVAGLVAVSGIVSNVNPPFIVQAAESGPEYETNTDNSLWLTEIYPNDINRNAVYGTDSDLMEFIEITNTGKQDISFNQEYGLYYEYPSGTSYSMKELGVTDSQGSSEVTIKSGETVVLWNQRGDITGGPTEEQFREAMNIASNVRVLKCSGQNGFGENDRGFAIKKEDGTIVSYFHYTTAVDTADGLGVELKIPDFGNEMQTFQQMKPASAGIAYYSQLNGRGNVDIPADRTPEGLFITEIRPNDKNRDAQFGSGANDVMECLELTNTTDKDINLNEEYDLYYVIKQGSKKNLTITSVDRSTTNCIIPANSSAVIWCDRQDYLKQGTDYTVWPSESEFRQAYSLSDTVPVFIMTNQNGLTNTNRGFELCKVNNDNTQTIVSSYFWDGVNDLKDNKSVDLGVNPQGPQMLVSTPCAGSNLGTVKDSQISYAVNDGSKPELKLLDSSTTYTQGDFIRIPFSFAGTDATPVTSIELYYKTPQMENFVCSTTNQFAIYNKYYAFIPSDVVLNAEYVDYYVKAWNNYYYTETNVKRLTNNKINSATKLNVRINNAAAQKNAEVSDTIYISAKNHADTSQPITATLDGNPLELNASLGAEAFYTFHYAGVDGYFKNALTCGDKVLKLIAKCSEIPGTSSMAVPVNGSYFTYNSDGSATIELAIRAGTYGSTWESDTEANNDDFNISNIALSLVDGTILTPVSFVNENGAALDYSGTTKMGDSTDCNIAAKAVFQIPASAVDGKGVSIDTKTLTDGAHTLAITSGTETKTITLNVKNTEETKPDKVNPEFNLGLTVDAFAIPVKATVTGAKAGNTIEVKEARTLSGLNVFEGNGDTTYEASKESGDGITTSVNGELPYQIYEISTDGTPEESMRFDVTAASDYNKEVQLYALNVKDDKWEILDTSANNGKVTTVFSLENRVKDGKVNILVQARGKENTPVTAKDAIKSSVTDTVWDGTTVPSTYDFSFAWISDTQYYVEQYMSNFTAMTDWILESRAKLGIEYVIHTGDIADEFNEEYQFINASKELKRFEEAGLPYGVLGGNHDVAHGNENYKNYWKYFGEERFNDKSYYGGSYNNNLGHYDLVNSNGQELLMIYMSWDIYMEQVEWINSVLAKYPERKAIICIHGGIDASGKQSYFSDLLINNVCKTNPNVIAILNGHYHGSSMNFVGFDDNGDGVNDRTVYQICTDYQSAPQGGLGYIKMLYFDLSNNKLYMNSYSPVLKDTNYFDTPKLPSYQAGDVARDIDIMELDVEFDTKTPKTLTVTNAEAALLTNQELGSAKAGMTAEVTIAKKDAVNQMIYAIEKDETGKAVAYSHLATYTKPDEPKQSEIPSKSDKPKQSEVPSQLNGPSQKNGNDTSNSEITTDSKKTEVINIKSRTAGTVNTGDSLKTPVIFILCALVLGSSTLFVRMALKRKKCGTDSVK